MFILMLHIYFPIDLIITTRLHRSCSFKMNINGHVCILRKIDFRLAYFTPSPHILTLQCIYNKYFVLTKVQTFFIYYFLPLSYTFFYFLSYIELGFDLHVSWVAAYLQMNKIFLERREIKRLMIKYEKTDNKWATRSNYYSWVSKQ